MSGEMTEFRRRNERILAENKRVLTNFGEERIAVLPLPSLVDVRLRKKRERCAYAKIPAIRSRGKKTNMSDPFSHKSPWATLA